MRFFSLLIVALVLMIFPCKAQEKGTFTDSRDGKTYKTVKIGERWWMAQNLAFTVCPDGWHLPTDEEWKHLERSLGMSLSESDSVNWRSSGRVDLKIMSTEWGNDKQGSNVSGFSALPGGISFANEYMPDTIFGLIREAADFWTSTAANDKKAWTRGVYAKTTGLGRGAFLTCDGLSVRCIRN